MSYPVRVRMHDVHKNKVRGLSATGGEPVDVSGLYQLQQTSISTSIFQCAMILPRGVSRARRGGCLVNILW